MANERRRTKTEARPKTAPAKKKRPRREKLIQTDPNVHVGPIGSWKDRAKLDAKSGLPGLLGSLGIHVIVLIILGVIVVQVSREDEDDSLLLSWLTADNSKRVETRQSFNLDSFQVKPDEPDKPKVEEQPDEPVDQPSVSPDTDLDPVEVKDLLKGRSSEQRQQLTIAAGGDERTQRAIESGLLWLKRHQLKAGNWQLHEGYDDPGSRALRTDTGATALALLAFLGAGNTHKSGDHKDAVNRGLQWLIRQQKSSGDLHDHVELGRNSAFYAHAQATIAICEAYALTQDPALRGPAEKAVRWLIESQQPINGGWKYQPQDERSIGDLSVTGWCLMALHTARVSGIEFTREPFEKSMLFLDSVQERNGAVYKYEPGDSPSGVTAAMTASGLLGRQFLGWPANHPSMIVGVEYLLDEERTPAWTLGKRNVYEWYYTGHVLHNLGGPRWKDWYAQVQGLIVDSQVRSGKSNGSWSPTDPPGATLEYAEKGGRLYFSCMCLLCLELPFRHLPIYEQDE